MLCIAVACRNKYNKKIGEIYMLGFIIGLFLGAFIGVCVMCLCNAASKADEQMEEHMDDEKKKQGIGDILNENYINENNIDSEHRIESVINDCKVTIFFSKNKNNQVERNVLENLLDTFENRMKAQIGC